jgi:hypothetical protein
MATGRVPLNGAPRSRISPLGTAQRLYAATVRMAAVSRRGGKGDGLAGLLLRGDAIHHLPLAMLPTDSWWVAVYSDIIDGPGEYLFYAAWIDLAGNSHTIGTARSTATSTPRPCKGDASSSRARSWDRPPRRGGLRPGMAPVGDLGADVEIERTEQTATRDRLTG